MKIANIFFHSIVAPAYAVVSSGKSSETHKTQAVFTPMLMINVILCALLFAALTAYILESNNITARQYEAQLLLGRQAAALEESGVLMEQNEAMEARNVVYAYAREHNMVPARDALHIIDSDGVALK